MQTELTTGTLVRWLEHWQSLLGAVVGGVSALLVAEFVNSSSRWRDTRKGAAGLRFEVERYAQGVSSLLKQVPQVRDGEGHHLDVALSYARSRPRLSPLFVGNAASVQQIDDAISAALKTFWTAVDSAERELEAIDERPWRTGAPGMSAKDAAVIWRRAVSKLELAAAVAEEALPLLTHIEGARFRSLALLRLRLGRGRTLERLETLEREDG